MKYKKVGIVGVGNVGSSIAYNLALKNICNKILLKDLREDFTKAVAIDLSQSISSVNIDTTIEAVSDDSEFSDCDIVVITAGIARKPGMTRDDLLFTNSKIMNSIVGGIIKYNENAILIIVSNPLDAMVYSALKKSNFQRNKVIGMAGILDTSRMKYFIKKKVGKGNIEAMVLGGHGDDMVPLIDETKIDGLPLKEYLNITEIDDVIEKTKYGGIEIVKLLKTGSAYFGPAQATVLMIESILEDKNLIYPCAVELKGEYGFENVVTGVPVKLGKNGVEEIIELNLNEEEKSNFNSSVNSVKELINKLENQLKE